MNCALVVNWLTAQMTLNAIKSVRQFYPDLHFFIVDDGSRVEDYSEMASFYKDDEYNLEARFDWKSSKLCEVENSTLLFLPRHTSHGACIDYAISIMQNNYKWCLLMDSDARMIKPAIEPMLEGIDDRTVMIGMEKIQDPSIPHVANFFTLFRPDLSYMYSAPFRPIYKDRLEAGHQYINTLKMGVKYMDLSEYFVHLRYGTDEQKALWKKYF